MDKILNAIMHWLNCSLEEAQGVWNGVKRIGDDYYSAFEENEKVVICKNGFPIHKLTLL